VSLSIATLRSDLAAIAADVPLTLIFNGTTVTGLHNVLGDDTEALQFGGFNAGRTMDVVVPFHVYSGRTLTLQLLSAPAIGTAVSANGETWRVESRERSLDGNAVELRLVRGCVSPELAAVDSEGNPFTDSEGNPFVV
jgi:hypothetical protein